MPFKRVWDVSCPQVYRRWETDGISWVIQDLDSKDDEEALKLLLEDLVPDELLCSLSGVDKDPVSMKCLSEFWRMSLGKRMSLACYAEEGGVRTLAALNCCVVNCVGEDEPICKIEGEAWLNVYNVLKHIDKHMSAFEYMGLDKVLYGLGLVVRRKYRGAKLGARLLAARKPLCISQGVKGTSTVFTGIASQKSADRAGFQTIFIVDLKELAESGLNYPKDDRVIKLKVKKYL